MAIDPDVQLIFNNLTSAMEALAARMAAVEGQSAQAVHPDSVTNTYADGTQEVWRRDL